MIQRQSETLIAKLLSVLSSSCHSFEFLSLGAHGTNGHWTDNYTIIQVKGSIDCLKGRVDEKYENETVFLLIIVVDLQRND